jgi:branched-chain amino acid transport system substrate-binding protein
MKKGEGKPLKTRTTLIAWCILIILLGAVRFSVAGQTTDIGLLFDLSGTGQEAGQAARWACEMAVDRVNAAGGVRGRLVRLMVFDTEGDPFLGNHGARELVLGRSVSAVVGPIGWDTAVMTKPFFQEAQVPVMMLTSEDSVIRGGKYGMYGYIFQLPLRRKTAFERMVGFLQETGRTRIGLVTESDGAGRDVVEWFREMGTSYGIEEVAVARLSPAEDMTESLEELMAVGLQAVVCSCSLPQAARVARMIRNIEKELPLFQGHAMCPHRYVSVAGPDARESLMVTNKMLVWEDLEDRDPQKALIRDFVHQYMDVYGYGRRCPVCPFLGYVWDSIMVLVRAMRDVGTDGTDMRDAIETIDNHVGLGGIYNFGYKDHNGLDPDSMVITGVDQIRGDGEKWVASWRIVNESVMKNAP